MLHPSTITDGYSKGLVKSPKCEFVVEINNVLWDVEMNADVTTTLFEFHVVLSDPQHVARGYVYFYDIQPPHRRFPVHVNSYQLKTTDSNAALDFRLSTLDYDVATIQWKLLAKHMLTLDSIPRFQADQLLTKFKDHFSHHFPGKNWEGTTLQNENWKVEYTTVSSYLGGEEYKFVLTSLNEVSRRRGLPKKIDITVENSFPLFVNVQEIPETVIDLLHDYITELKLFT